MGPYPCALGGGGSPTRVHSGLPPSQAPPSLQIRDLRPRFAAVASNTAAAVDITAPTAPVEHENLPLKPLGRVHSFVRRLIALFPGEQNSLVPPFDVLTADFAGPKSVQLFKRERFQDLVTGYSPQKSCSVAAIHRPASDGVS
jgi:hypothetical protein